MMLTLMPLKFCGQVSSDICPSSLARVIRASFYKSGEIMGFCFDVETLATESTSVILSAAIVYFEPKSEPSYQDLLDNTLFVKFNAEEQISQLKRIVNKSTLDWWKTQPDYARQVSFNPKKDDLTAEEGIDRIIRYMDRYPNPREQTMWARGSLDQVTIDSLCRQIDKPTISEYYTWRDVRTAIDILYGSSNGYCGIEHPEFNRDLVIKHAPYHDVCLDVMMLLYGKERND